MTIAIIRVPSCLDIDFNGLERIKNNGFIDYYEVRNANSEIVLYWRGLLPNETKNLQINLIQRFIGIC